MRRDGRPLTSRVSEDFPGVITLREATLEDAGIYECRASNIAGETTLSTNLEVQQPPTIAVYPDVQSLELTEGDELKFNCIASGVPTPSVQIKLPEGLNARTMGIKTSEINRDQAEASISHYNVQRNQAGLYECAANNEAGQDIRYIQVNVAVKRGDAGMISLCIPFILALLHLKILILHKIFINNYFSLNTILILLFVV